MECILQGVIESQHTKALSEFIESLGGHKPKKFKNLEICLKSGPGLGAVASEVRLIQALHNTPPTWTLRHVGGSLRGTGADQLPALVRSHLETDVSSRGLALFEALGFEVDTDMLCTGSQFQFQRSGVTLFVSISTLHGLPRAFAVDEAVPIAPGLSIVEVVGPATSETYTETASAVAAFAELLSPLLKFSKPGVSAGVVPEAGVAAKSMVVGKG